MPAPHTANRRWEIGVMALMAGLILAACGAAGVAGGANAASSSLSHSAPNDSGGRSGGVTIADLTNVARQEALDARDPAVHVAYAVLTTRQTAATLVSGDGVNSNEAVDLVQLEGQFTLTDVSVPPGGTAPTGTDLDLDVDVSGGSVVDRGLTNKAADLSKLGAVIVLTL